MGSEVRILPGTPYSKIIKCMTQKTPFCKVPFLVGFTSKDEKFRDCCSKAPYIDSDANQKFEDWWSSKKLNDFKQQLLDSDEWPSECLNCKKKEDQLGHSFRLAVNKWPETDYRYPCAWNISFVNTCNLACWTCHEDTSSTIFQHKKRAGLINGNNTYKSKFERRWPTLRENILKSYEYHENVTLTILGGEPLYNPIVKEFLKELIDKNLAPRTNLEFHTNGTQYPDRLLPPISESPWKYTCIFISLDAAGKYAEWLRYGCDWDKVDRVVDKLKQAANLVEIHCVLSVLNINQITTLREYADSKNLKLRINIAIQPAFMALEHWDLPADRLLVNPINESYKEFYDMVGSKPIKGSSERLKEYIRKFDGVRRPLSDFDEDFSKTMNW